MERQYTLLFRLEGPMQSWGYRSRFDARDTALEPTRSGVIGLVCSAMGIARDEDISRFDGIRLGVRVDRQGRPARDYHTAMGVVRADGSGRDTVVSNRDYLSDASFTVGLESQDRDLLDEIAESLRQPVWTLFLGRKSFPLSVPPIGPDDGCVAGTLEDHLNSGKLGRRIVLESDGGERTQHDWPICFEERRFRPRSIRTVFEAGGDSA